MVDLCRDSTMPEQAPIVLAAPSVPLYGRGVTDSGGKPPCVRGLVWLTKPVPLRGEPWSFNLIKDRTLWGYQCQVMQSLIGLYPYKVWHFTP